MGEIREYLDKIETEISNILRDKTDKNKILLLSEKCDNLNEEIVKLVFYKNIYELYRWNRRFKRINYVVWFW